MSQENVEIVRRAFEIRDEGDYEALRPFLDDELVTRRLGSADPGTWRGPEGLRQSSAEWVEGFDAFTMRTEEFLDGGEHVIVQVSQDARGSASGVPVKATFWFVCGLREGKLR